jgi:hypothetical protein
MVGWQKSTADHPHIAEIFDKEVQREELLRRDCMNHDNSCIADIRRTPACKQSQSFSLQGPLFKTNLPISPELI